VLRPEGADAATIDRAIAAANNGCLTMRRCGRWARVPEPFSFDNGLLTSNGRLRRRDIVESLRRAARRASPEELAS